MKRASRPLILVSPAELQYLITALSSGLECDSPGVSDTDDAPSVLRRWKAYRGRYVADSMDIYKKIGRPVKKADCRRDDLAKRDKEAAMLARLYPLLAARKAAA